MSSVLYQTFYPYNKFDSGSSIHKLEKWMLSKDALYNLLRRHPHAQLNDIEKKMENEFVATETTFINIQKLPKPQFIVPDKMDTLFWCIYISYYGEAQYLAIGNKYGNAEIAEKKKIMEKFKN